MLKDVKHFEVKIEDKVYHMFCDPQSPIGHVKEALFQFSKIVAQVEESILAAQIQAVEDVKSAQADLVTIEEVQ